MGRICYLLILMIVFARHAHAQETDYANKLTIGITYGAGQSSNAFRQNPETSDYYLKGKGQSNSYGADLGISLARKWRTRLKCEYVGYSYGIRWTNGSTFDKTNVKLFNVDWGVLVDYCVFQSGRLKCYVSPGVVGEFVQGSEYFNTFADGSTNYKKFNTVSDNDHRENYFGANLGLLMSYNVTKWLAVRMDGGYTRFFQKYHADNDNAYTRLGFGAGVEVKLF